MRLTLRTTKSVVSFAAGWKQSFVTSCLVESLQNCPQGTIFCLRAAVSSTHSDCWSSKDGHAIHQTRRTLLGADVMPHSNVLDAKWECLKGAAPTHHTTVVHNMHQISWWRDSNVSCQGQTFPNYHQPTHYFHKLLRRAYRKGSVMRQLVTLNSGYLKYMRGGRVSRGHFGLRRWKIMTTSTFYTLFQGTNIWFWLLN